MALIAIEVKGLSGLPFEVFSEVFPAKLVELGLTCFYHRLSDDSESAKFMSATEAGDDIFIIGRITHVN